MTQEHIITREMLIATLADVMADNQRQERELKQYREDASTMIAKITHLRERNDKLASDNETYRQSQLGLNAELSRMHKEYTDETHRRDLEFTRVVEERDRALKRACSCEYGPGRTAYEETLQKDLDGVTKQRDQLLSQLPTDMKTCKITFTECKNGHGMLTAQNWVQHPCPWCKLAKLRTLFALRGDDVSVEGRQILREGE